MPWLHVHNHITRSLASNCYRRTNCVKNLDERYWTTRDRIDRFDMTTATSEFGQWHSSPSCMFDIICSLSRLGHDIIQTIIHHTDKTTNQLGMVGTRVEQSRSAMKILESRKFVIDLKSKSLFVCLTQWKTHCNPHPHPLRFFHDIFLIIFDQISMMERIESEIIENIISAIVHT